MKKPLLLLALVALAGCAHDVSTVRMGAVFPARPDDCELELRTEPLSQELLAAYQTVGAVMIRGNLNEPPNAPRLLALLKPQACALGGDIVLVNTSMNVSYPGTFRGDDSQHSYLVLRKKGATATAPQKF